MAKRKNTNDRLEGNKYDKIIKENILSLIPALLKRVIGIEVFRMEDLPMIKLQTTIEREPDFLKEIFTKEFPKGRISHLEFESGNERDMEKRMLEYYSIIYRKLKKPIDQHLIYLGNKPSTMKDRVEEVNLSFRYTIHNLCEISYKQFIDSTEPEEVILSILANRDDLTPEAIIHLILNRLIALRGDSLATRKFIRQLEILSKMRNLQELTTKTIDNMSISYDITTDVRFKQGKEEGKEQGVIQGIKQGELIKAITSIRNNLKKGNVIDSNTLASILDISVKFVDETTEELKKEVEIMKALSVKRARINTIAKKFEVSPILVRTLKKIKAKEKKKSN